MVLTRVRDCLELSLLCHDNALAVSCLKLINLIGLVVLQNWGLESSSMAKISACSRPCQLWRYHSLIEEILFGSRALVCCIYSRRSSESSVISFVLQVSISGTGSPEREKEAVVSFFTDRILLVGQDYGSKDGRRHDHYRIQNF